MDDLLSEFLTTKRPCSLAAISFTFMKNFSAQKLG